MHLHRKKLCGCPWRHVCAVCLFWHPTRITFTVTQVIMHNGLCRSLYDAHMLAWFVGHPRSRHPFCGCVLPWLILIWWPDRLFCSLHLFSPLWSVLLTRKPFIDSLCVFHTASTFDDEFLQVWRVGFRWCKRWVEHPYIWHRCSPSNLTPGSSGIYNIRAIAINNRNPHWH